MPKASHIYKTSKKNIRPRRGRILAATVTYKHIIPSGLQKKLQLTYFLFTYVVKHLTLN